MTGDRWEVLVDVEDEPDVVSYLVEAPDQATAREQIAYRPEVECVHQVIRMRRAER